MHSALPLFAAIDIDTHAPQPHKLTAMQSSSLICAPVSFAGSIVGEIRGWLWHTFAHYQYYSKSFCFHHSIFTRYVVTAILPISPCIRMPFKGLQGFIQSEAQLLSTSDTNNHLGLLWHLSGVILWSGSPQLNCNKLRTNFVSRNNSIIYPVSNTSIYLYCHTHPVRSFGLDCIDFMNSPLVIFRASSYFQGHLFVGYKLLQYLHTSFTFTYFYPFVFELLHTTFLCFLSRFHMSTILHGSCVICQDECVEFTSETASVSFWLHCSLIGHWIINELQQEPVNMHTRCLCEHANLHHSRLLPVLQPTSILTALRVLGPRGACVSTGCQEFCPVNLKIHSTLKRAHPEHLNVRMGCLFAPNQIAELVVQNTLRTVLGMCRIYLT